MKRILFAVLSLSLFSVFAELYPARRYVEFGFGAEFMASQNGLPLNDVFKKHVTLDLKKIYSDMSGTGFTTSLSSSEDVHLAFNFERFGIGLYTGAEFSARLNISKDLFKALDGISPGAVYSGEANIWAQSFATVSVPIRFNVKKWRVTVRPTYFVPIVYVPSTTVRGSAVNNTDGSVTAVASAPIEIYTVRELKGLVQDGEFSADFIDNLDSSASDLASDILNGGGVDLTASVEYPLLEKLDIGGYVRTPLFPGRMKHKVSALATLSVRSDSLLEMMFDDESPDTTAEFSDATYSRANYIVNRPFRLGAECAWRPFGKWFTVRGLLGMGLRNPFGQDVDIKSLYPEYKLGVEVVGIGMFGLGVNTEYTQKVFAHSLDIMLNFRAVEFDFSAAVASPTFVQSFKGEGLAASFGMKMGW